MKVMYWIMNMTFFSPQTLLSIPGWLTILPPILTAIIAIAFRLVLPMHVYVMYVPMCGESGLDGGAYAHVMVYSVL